MTGWFWLPHAGNCVWLFVLLMKHDHPTKAQLSVLAGARLFLSFCDRQWFGRFSMRRISTVSHSLNADDFGGGIPFT